MRQIEKDKTPVEQEDMRAESSHTLVGLHTSAGNRGVKYSAWSRNSHL